MINNKWASGMLLIAGLLSVMSCSNSKENKAVNDEKAISVSVATPGSDDARSISLAGRVEALQSANIGTRVMGYITKIYVKTGDKVEKGQLLFSINSDDILAKRSQVDASVAQAEAAFNSAQKDFDRYTVLFKQQSATSKELDNITLQYKSAKAGLESAKQMRNEVTAQLSYANVVAPFNGVVTQKFTDAGNLASPGMPVLTIETNNILQVTATVPETQISGLQLGADANLVINAAGINLKGKVSEISSSSQNSGSVYIIKISIPDGNRKNLMAGMYVNVSIPVADTAAGTENTDAVLVPASSIIHKGELDGIYTVSNDNQALLRWVRLGKPVNDQVEVLSGLGKSEKFIVRADGNLYNGVAVKIAE